jgi:hypothetical protein
LEGKLEEKMENRGRRRREEEDDEDDEEDDGDGSGRDLKGIFLPIGFVRLRCKRGGTKSPPPCPSAELATG